MKFTSDFITLPVSRKASDTQKPPELGAIAELIRQKLTDEFNVYPPNLNTAINQDNSITLTAVNPDSGLNLQIVLSNPTLNQAQQGQLPNPPGNVPPPNPPAQVPQVPTPQVGMPA